MIRDNYGHRIRINGQLCIHKGSDLPIKNLQGAYIFLGKHSRFMLDVVEIIQMDRHEIGLVISNDGCGPCDLANISVSIS